MPTTYRWTIKTDDHRLRHMMSPHGSLTVRRASAKALAGFIAAFRAELAKHVPHTVSAAAWLEVSDKYGSRTLLRFRGEPTVHNGPTGRPYSYAPPCAVIKGRWTAVTLRGDVDPLDTVEAG